MSGKYWFTPLGGGTFAIGTGDSEIATTPSLDVASKITEALNAMEDGTAPPRKFEVTNRLKEWRVRRDLTQQQLADLIGVTQGTVARYEKNNLALDITILARFANALQVPPHHLISHGEQE